MRLTKSSFETTHCFSSCVSSKQELSPVLEHLELELLQSPLRRDHLQFRLNVLLFQGGDANVLDVLLVLQKGRLHDVPQRKVLPLKIELVVCQTLCTMSRTFLLFWLSYLNPLPMARLHRFVAHQLKQGTNLEHCFIGFLYGDLIAHQS